MNYRSILIALTQTMGLYLAGFLIPVLGQVVALFTPVPVATAYVRYGRREGVSALLASCAVIAVLAGWQLGAVLFFSFGLMALGLAEAMKRGLKAEYVALAGGMLPVLAAVLAVSYYFTHIGKNPVVVIENYLAKSMAESARLYTSIGLREMATMINSISPSFIHYLARLVPGIVVTTSVMQAACCFGVVRFLLLRKKEAGISLSYPSLAEWHSPDSWVWGLIACLTLLAIPQETLRLTGLNLAILCIAVYTTQGVAVVEHYFRKAKIHFAVRSILHTMILILPSVAFVIALGIVDVWADFRKLRGPVQQT